MVLFNYFLALKLSQEKRIGLLPLTGFGILIGGLTITNLVKVYIPVLFEKNLFGKWKNIGKAILNAIISAGIFIFLYLWRLDFRIQLIIEQTSTQYEKFSKPKVTPLWDMMTSWFWGGSILFLILFFIVRDYKSKTGFQYKGLFMDVYSSWVSYLFIAIITVLIIWGSLLITRINWFRYLDYRFLCDVIIHCVLKFGLHTSYIYGGHFIFVVPMLLGWLFTAREGIQNYFGTLDRFDYFIRLFRLFNNIYRLTEFITFANQYYR